MPTEKGSSDQEFDWQADLVENYLKEDRSSAAMKKPSTSCSLAVYQLKEKWIAFDELEENRKLPDSFIENFIINSPSENVMNNMQ